MSDPHKFLDELPEPPIFDVTEYDVPDMDTEWASWLELTFDPDNPPIDRIEDIEI